MKPSLLFALLCLFLCLKLSAQGTEFRVKYYLNQKGDKNSDNVFFEIKDTIVTYQKGWTETKTIGEKSFEVTLTADRKDTIQVDSLVDLDSKWKIGEVDFTDDDASKIYFNPWSFKDANNNNKVQMVTDSHPLNQKGYISVPGNGYVVLRKNYWSISPVTIPFAIRFALNDTIGSQATADLNLGVSFSHNTNYVVFKNRRIKAAMTSYGVSYGVGFGFSRIELSPDNTSLAGTDVLKREESGLAFTVSPGIGLNLNGFHVAGFIAYDIALTNNVKVWNYYQKPYIGVGFGLNLETLGNLTK